MNWIKKTKIDTPKRQKKAQEDLSYTKSDKQLSNDKSGRIIYPRDQHINSLSNTNW